MTQRTCTPLRGPLALTLTLIAGFIIENPPAHAYELYNHDGSVLNANLEAVFAIMRSKESYAITGNRSVGESAWREGYLKYGLSGSQALADFGSVYGAVDWVSSGTWGDGDAAGFTLGSERRTAIEDAHLGWRSGDLFPILGTDGVDISGGRQVLKIGDGFLLNGDSVNVGDADLGGNFDRGGAYYLAARKAFDQTAAIRLGGDKGWRGDLLWLKSDNRAQAETELAAATVEHVNDLGTFGVDWIRTLDVNERFASAFQAERSGMDTVSLRGTGGLGVDNLKLGFEYATQDRDSGRENACYLEGSWTFADSPWKPTATYRYSRFSEQFDPLFYGFSRGYGTWYQGEVAANYAGPFNSNTQVHHVGLKASPRDDLTVGALFFDFDTLNQNLGNLSGRELDFYAEWTINEHLMISPLAGFYKPETSADGGGTQVGNDDLNTYLQVTVATFF